MSAFVAFFVGCFVGATVGMFFFAVVMVSNDAERRQDTHINKDARQYFGGLCPYTAQECESWRCNECEVEKAEREYLNEEDPTDDIKLF